MVHIKHNFQSVLSVLLVLSYHVIDESQINTCSWKEIFQRFSAESQIIKTFFPFKQNIERNANITSSRSNL